MKKTKIIHMPAGMRFRSGFRKDSGPPKRLYKKPSQRGFLKSRFGISRKNSHGF